ncbi:MAG: tRNA (5-methylaminomethyl-2-thiouridine)(34)-methyltransferase MnmD [Planctomycetota bacterium]
MGRPLELAEVSWRDGRLWSERFGDVYASMGLAEARHVMLAGAGLPGRWKDLEAEWPDGVFMIGELGFGAGMNFLAAWAAWDRVAEHRVPGRLRYVAVEGYPLGRGDLERGLRGLEGGEALGDRVRRLVEAWPVDGVEDGACSVLRFGSVELELRWGGVSEVMERWAVEDRVDAWFLDGFSPAKNPAMWEPGVLRRVGELSRVGARMATYTVAGAVRRGLSEAGFDVRKREGLGKKRHVLTGVLTESPRMESVGFVRSGWEEIDRVLVIGAGIAGCGVVKALAEAGVSADRVRVWDGGGEASAASGNAAGIVQPKMGSAPRSPAVAWYASAFSEMAGWLEGGGDGVGFRCGAVHVGVNDRQLERLRAAVDSGLGVWVEAGEASERLGVEVERGGVWVPGAWVVRPGVVCRRWLEEAGVEVERREAGSLNEALAAVGEVGESGAVVLANGDGVLGGEALVGALRGRVAGQVSGWRVAGGEWLKAVLCYGGYALPAVDGVAWLGATYDHGERADARGVVASLGADDEANREGLRAACVGVEGLLPRGPVVASRASVRVTTRDRLPVVGWLGSGVGGGRVYASLGHGSRGLTGGLLSGRLAVASMGLSGGREWPERLGLPVLATR